VKDACASFCLRCRAQLNCSAKYSVRLETHPRLRVNTRMSPQHQDPRRCAHSHNITTAPSAPAQSSVPPPQPCSHLSKHKQQSRPPVPPYPQLPGRRTGSDGGNARRQAFRDIDSLCNELTPSQYGTLQAMETETEIYPLRSSAYTKKSR